MFTIAGGIILAVLFFVIVVPIAFHLLASRRFWSLLTWFIAAICCILSFSENAGILFVISIVFAIIAFKLWPSSERAVVSQYV